MCKGRLLVTLPGTWAVTLGLAVGLAGCPASLIHREAHSPGRIGAAAALPGDDLSPAQAWTAYDLRPLLRAGIDGKGQTIAVVDPFGSPTIAHDVAAFDQRFGCRRCRCG